MEQNITRTVYSIAWPPTKSILQTLISEDMSSIFSETWTKKQDSMHTPFLEQFKDMAKNHVQFPTQQNALNFSYPTNGSSEAICQQINFLNTQGKRLVVFEQEYEGYLMMAKNMNMPTLIISRDNYHQELQKLNSTKDVFFLSQPSSIDGNYWQDFHHFMEITQNLEIPVYVDLAYTVLVNHPLLNLNYSNISGVFFSLSKIFGVYYHRIGGCFLKEANPLLWPNLWFKNLLSIQYGQKLMMAYSNGDFNNTYSKLVIIQNNIVSQLQQRYNVDVLPCDVPFLVLMKYTPEQHPWMKEYIRSESPDYIRVCISPLLEQQLYSND